MASRYTNVCKDVRGKIGTLTEWSIEFRKRYGHIL